MLLYHNTLPAGFPQAEAALLFHRKVRTEPFLGNLGGFPAFFDLAEAFIQQIDQLGIAFLHADCIDFIGYNARQYTELSRFFCM